MARTRPSRWPSHPRPSSRPSPRYAAAAPWSSSPCPPDNHVDLPIFETVLRGITIRGSIVGTRKDLAEVYAIHAQGRTRVIHEVRKLDEVNDCFHDVEQGHVKARIVFDLR